MPIRPDPRARGSEDRPNRQGDDCVVVAGAVTVGAEGVLAVTAAAIASDWAFRSATSAFTWVMSVAAFTRAASPWMSVMADWFTVVSRATAAVRSSMALMVFFPSVTRSERRLRIWSTFASILPIALNMRATLCRRGLRPHALPRDLEYHAERRAPVLGGVRELAKRGVERLVDRAVRLPRGGGVLRLVEQLVDLDEERVHLRGVEDRQAPEH